MILTEHVLFYKDIELMEREDKTRWGQFVFWLTLLEIVVALVCLATIAYNVKSLIGFVRLMLGW